MSFDPSEYDLSELRTGNGNGDVDGQVRGGAPGDGTSGRDASHPDERGRSRRRRGDRGHGRGGGRGRARDRAREGLRPEEIIADNRFEELLERERAAAPEALERPYLTRVPHAYRGVETTFEWLDYLLRRAGRRRTRKALDYYEGLGWLSEAAIEELNTYLDGLNPPAGEPDDLGVDDHRASLVYVTRLAVLTANE